MNPRSASPEAVLAIIPVRGGSKRIHRKWAQLIGGKPMLQWTIDVARGAQGIDRLVVCTDDPEVASYAALRGVEVIDRPAELAKDDVPLAAVFTYVTEKLEWKGTVAVLQATCPLLSSETLTQTIQTFQEKRPSDWVITSAPQSHIFWQNGKPIVPRINSQDLAKNAVQVSRESGAIQIMTADYARTQKGTQSTLPIPAAEALDIDTFADLEEARLAVGKRTILFHVLASKEKGSGHLRRSLQLSEALGYHRIVWAKDMLEDWALEEAMRRQVTFVDPHGITPDLVIIDALDAAHQLAPFYASKGIKVMVFECSDGTAQRFADEYVDEFVDPKTTILRPEFRCLPPYEVRPAGRKVLVTFGGTDPTGMNERVEKLVAGDAKADVISLPAQKKVVMAELMRNADLVVTSQGRTVHEAAALGVPCLSIAVNERESRHAKLPGVVYLGLAATLADMAILDTVNRLLDSPALRREMSLTSSQAIDGRGINRVIHRIQALLEKL